MSQKMLKKAGAVCFLLIMAVWGVFGQTARYGFINYDDDLCVYENASVLHGLTAKGVAQAFSPGQAGFFYPLTTLSFMTDIELFGLDAGRLHLTNVLLHAVTATLLFLVLYSMTGLFWRSAFVAAVFALHPLRVESVAWITERKDVLSGVFFMLTLGAYVRYVRRPFALSGYLAVLVFFILGLLSKPTLVTLPGVLLLLDWWPLGRFPYRSVAAIPPCPASFRRIFFEKIPLMVLSVLMSALTLFSHAQKESVDYPLVWRAKNAVVSYAIYIRQMLWPAGLSVHYPQLPEGRTVWEVTLSMIALTGISLIVFMERKRRSYLIVGWLWYLGILVPMIGLTRILGDAAHADRFTYLPLIGLTFMVTWLVADLFIARKNGPAALTVTAAVILTVLMVQTHMQTRYWRDNFSLWNHALAHTANNFLAHNNLGAAFCEKGCFDKAFEQFEQAININPDFPDALINAGRIFLQREELEKAVLYFGKALRMRPGHYIARNNLGQAFYKMGRSDEAAEQFEKSIDLRPDLPEAYNDLGMILYNKNRLNEALEQFKKALEIYPDNVLIHENMGNTFLRQKNFKQAFLHFEKALQINPDSVKMKNNLAWLLATCPDAEFRDGKRAVQLALSVCQLSKGDCSLFLDTLAAAYAEAGQYPEAVKTARLAINAAGSQKNIVADIQMRLHLYEKGAPYHE